MDIFAENQNPIPVEDEVDDIDSESISDTNDHKPEQGVKNGENWRRCDTLYGGERNGKGLRQSVCQKVEESILELWYRF